MPISTATSHDVERALRRRGDKDKAIFLRRFFKTGPGEYAEKDQFLGVTVPEQRKIAKQFHDLPLPQLRRLLRSEIHEDRLTALLIMVAQYERANASMRERLYRLYLAHTRYINNWDLVDGSAEILVGRHIARHPRPTLRRLIRSRLLWERRIGVIATFHFIKSGNAGETLWVAKQLLNDEHDLMHKAVGWMLREVGKRVAEKPLHRFLRQYAHKMPRTMLRYAIERFPPSTRRKYLAQQA